MSMWTWLLRTIPKLTRLWPPPQDGNGLTQEEVDAGLQVEELRSKTTKGKNGLHCRKVIFSHLKIDCWNTTGSFFLVLCLFLGGYACAEAYVLSRWHTRTKGVPTCPHRSPFLELVGNGLARDSSEYESKNFRRLVQTWPISKKSFSWRTLKEVEGAHFWALLTRITLQRPTVDERNPAITTCRDV